MIIILTFLVKRDSFTLLNEIRSVRHFTLRIVTVEEFCVRGSSGFIERSTM